MICRQGRSTVAIAVFCGYLLVKKNLSIPKTILLAAVLGLLI